MNTSGPLRNGDARASDARKSDSQPGHSLDADVQSNGAIPEVPASPYVTIADGESRSPGGRFLIIRLAFSFTVFAASCMIAEALLVGTAIAVAGYQIPGPFKFSDVLASPVGQWLRIGSYIAVPFCLMLACFSYGRIARTQRALLDTVSKRDQLHRQLQELRSDYALMKQQQPQQTEAAGNN